MIWGLATAFENYDKNNLQNLKKLLSTGEVIGDTFATLSERGLLNFNRLKYGIPFPVAWDKIVECEENLDVRAQKIIARDFQNFNELPEPKKELILKQVKSYSMAKKYDAISFEAYGLMGTPSSLLIDKKGVLRYKFFGAGQELDQKIESLLGE